ncbi:alpha/beta hydrolase [Falsigemmobacter intermedius]|uniref:Alpha/beta-hydrolase catalytic domain-containing protein n=1 Tax=Falsigemmobacter intermedius TaxID=1553448 RepID=A0A444MAX1_9RHOB|nr:alpha/beta-hydrolase family protein [Falsigemmobacter intermedius]RWY40618.1 hypothetical protein EP867_11465 [Falsigemmobacter intermedius]
MSKAALSSLFHLSAPAAFAGALAFSAALTPSLVPRSGMLQGGLAGLAFAAAYLLVVLLLLIWQTLGLPVPRGRGAERAGASLKALGAVVMVAALAQASAWQNEIRLLMELEPVETVRPLTIALTAAVLAFVLIWLGRLFRLAVGVIERRLSRHLPPRLAFVTGLIGAVFVFNLLGNDVLLSRIYTALDKSYALIDRALPEDQPPPLDGLRSGGPGSLLSWGDLGAEGRNRVADPLDAATIAEITGAPALEPLRLYVGLGSASTPEERADLALREAIRIGAFERRRLVLATPTGTGWVDPAAMVPLEVVTGGDVATVSVQYSYLPSWLSLLTVQSYGVQTAQATFSAFHRYWQSLPEDSRPEFWLFGLSLGALHSDLSADLYDVIAAPYTGAFRAGPPFAGQSWQHLTADRAPESPAWRPLYGDGRVVRFINQTSGSTPPPAAPDWGPVRILYLQYPSDGITFFSPNLLWRRPAWLSGPAPHDVSPNLRWLPLVTFFQVGFDLLTATTTPAGYGHVYAARDYLYGWQSLLNDPPLSTEAMARLNALFRARNL